MEAVIPLVLETQAGTFLILQENQYRELRHILVATVRIAVTIRGKDHEIKKNLRLILPYQVPVVKRVLVYAGPFASICWAQRYD